MANVHEAARRTKLYAVYGVLDESEDGPAIDLEAWRIGMDDDSAIETAFASQRDVERVILELAKRGVVDAESYDASPLGTTNECIADALPW
jgi:hypothetical protein